MNPIAQMTPTEFCDHYGACYEGREFALKFATMAEVWDACERPDWLFWILEKHAPLAKEQSVRLAIAFAENVLPHVPEGEDRPRLAIEAAKAWLADPTEENQFAAARAARAAADAAYAAADAAAAAAAAARAARAARADAARADAARAARAARAADNCKILRSIVPNPFLG